MEDSNPTLLSKQDSSSALLQGSKGLMSRSEIGYNPFSQDQLYDKKSTSWSKRAFTNLSDRSLRLGSIGLIGSILGTGVLALPFGIAQVGWLPGAIFIVLSALCQVATFYFFAFCQAKIPDCDVYSSMVERLVSRVHNP